MEEAIRVVISIGESLERGDSPQMRRVHGDEPGLPGKVRKKVRKHEINEEARVCFR